MIVVLPVPPVEPPAEPLVMIEHEAVVGQLNLLAQDTRLNRHIEQSGLLVA